MLLPDETQKVEFPGGFDILSDERVEGARLVTPGSVVEGKESR